MSNKNTLDAIINTTISTVGESREQIFQIGEHSREEYETLEQELRDVRIKVAEVIDKSDKTETLARYARNRLAEVSKNFDKFSNEEVHTAYKIANQYQVDLAVLRQKEAQLRARRDNIERRLINLKCTIDRAEILAGQMSVVYNFLAGDLKVFGEKVKDAEEKQKFSLKIIEVQEEERKRLSREIHDGPAQMMANVLLRSELVERIYQEQGIAGALQEMRELRKMVKLSLAEVRRIIYDLRPMALDDLGLIPTLAKYLKTFEEHANMHIVFRNLGEEKRLLPNVEVALFRLVQEAVQNAHKHAKAKEVRVNIDISSKNAVIVVKDDGVGFDQSVKKEGSFGLIGMKERVTMLKGKMNIRSKENEGTTIVIDVPLK